MADVKKVSELDAITTTVSTDLMEVAQDDGDGSYTSKKITVGNLKSDVLSLNQATPQTVSGGIPVFSSGIACGGSTEGMSTTAKGWTINNAQGSTATDDFIAKTANKSDALVVDASADEVQVNVPLVVSGSASSVKVGTHIGHTNVKRIVLLDEDGNSLMVYLRNGILTID